MWRDTLTSLLEKGKDNSREGIHILEQAGQQEFISYQLLYQEALNALFGYQLKGWAEGSPVIVDVAGIRPLLVHICACLLGKYTPVVLQVV